MKNFFLLFCFAILFIVVDNGPLFKDIYHKEWKPVIVEFAQTQLENTVNFFAGEVVAKH